MTHPAPAQPGDIDAADLVATSKKVFCIGADLAASALRRCKHDTREASDALHAALTHVNVYSRKPKSNAGNNGGKVNG